MADVLELALALTLNVVVTWQVLRWDMRKLSEKQLDRAWNDASFWAAVVAFGPLCLPFHFAKTRRSVVGFLLGVLALVLALSAIVAVGAVLEAISSLARPESG